MPKTNHEQENQLLTLCAGAPGNMTDTTALDLGREEIDWDYFYRLARRHSLVPVVFRQLQTIKAQIPGEVLNRFKKDYQENAARNLILVDELITLLERFAKQGVEALVFKGPALAILAYGDLDLRRFVDLDLIVRRGDMDRAIEVLLQNGYVLSRALTAEQQAVLLRTQHNLQFTKGRVIVELHWQVSSELFAATVTAEELWDNPSTVKLNGHTLKTLSTEDLLFALCVHGSRHLWQRLAWICDIDRLIKINKTLNWPKLCERAKQANLERMFLLGPALAARLLGTDLPEPIAQVIARDRRIRRLCDEIRARLFDSHQSAPPLLAVVRFNLLIRSGWRSRIRYGRFLFAPTDSDLDAVKLRPPLHFIYYFLRPLRFLQSAMRQH
jgi:hypothetical protein